MEDFGDVQKALEGKGIELSLDEIRRVKERADRIRSGEAAEEQPEPMAEGELSEDELMDVAGGEITWDDVWTNLVGILMGW